MSREARSTRAGSSAGVRFEGTGSTYWSICHVSASFIYGPSVSEISLNKSLTITAPSGNQFGSVLFGFNMSGLGLLGSHHICPNAQLARSLNMATAQLLVQLVLSEPSAPA